MKSKKTTKRDPNEEEKDPSKIKKIQEPEKPARQRLDTKRRTGDIPGRPSGLGDLGFG